MKYRAHLYALAGLVWALIPFIAEAALVPCGQSSNPNITGSLSCDLCSLGELIQNIINYLLGLSVPVAAGLFAWAGILYFSSRGVPSQIEKAHKIFRSVVIGFVIAIAAWTIVQAVVTTIFNKSIFNGGSWNTLDCRTQRDERAKMVNRSLTDVLAGLPPLTVGVTQSGAMYCPSGYVASGDACANPNNNDDRVSPLQSNGSTITCQSGYTPFFDQCMNNDTGDIINSVANTAYREPTSYSSCYGSDQLQGGYCQGDEGGYPAFANSYSAAGPEGKCQSGYTYTQDAEYAWCQGSNGAEDIQDFLPAGKGGGPIVTCDASDPKCADISSAVSKYFGTNTSAGPDNGNLACAWSVNNILKDAGIAPIDGNSVQSMRSELDAGRGTSVSLASAQPGDIIVWQGIGDNGKTVSHVGFCENAGCTVTDSNSSYYREFGRNTYGSTLNGVTGVVYNVKR